MTTATSVVTQAFAKAVMDPRVPIEKLVLNRASLNIWRQVRNIPLISRMGDQLRTARDQMRRPT